MRGYLDQSTKLTALCCILYVVWSAALYAVTGIFFHAFLTWNVFLSLLPFLFARLLEEKLYGESKAIAVLFALLWLLFFPNAPYMITDLIHIRFKSFSAEHFAASTLEWVKLIHIGTGVMLGILLGMRSLAIMHRLAAQAKGKRVAHAALLVVCLLSGYAVYIGRFLRVNSWDIARPLSFVRTLLGGMNGLALFYSLMMAAFILFSYLIFRAFFPDRAK